MEYNVFTIHWVSADINSPLQEQKVHTRPYLGMEYNLCLFAFSFHREIKYPHSTFHAPKTPKRCPPEMAK